MKLSAFLPFALGNQIPRDLTGNDELKFGHSLCESDECPDFDGKISHEIEIIDDEISTASCSKEYKNSFLSGRMDRCEYYNASHSDCVTWATNELNSACGGKHNCVETKWSGISGYAQYWGYSSK